MRRWLVAGACALAGAGAAVASGLGETETQEPPAQRAAPSPDTVVVNGRITTMAGRASTVQALAIRNGEIVAVGRDVDVRALAGRGTRVVDLGGRRVVPGLVDGSLRGVAMGSYFCSGRSPRFDGVYRRVDALRVVADRAARTPAGKWLFQVGEAWSVAQFETPGMIGRAELDAIAPSHPVYLQAAGVRGGGAQLNSLGMRELGLEAGDPGVVVDATRKATGQVTGPAQRRAMRAIGAELEGLTAEEQEGCTRHAIRELNRRGVTAWDDAGGENPFSPAGARGPVLRGDHAYQAVSRLHRTGELNARIRLNTSCSGTEAGLPCVERATAERTGELGDDTLRIGGLGDEVLVPGPRSVYPTAAYRRILEHITSAGWALEHRAAKATTQQGMLADWEASDARRTIRDLRWRMIGPGDGPTEPNADALTRLKDLDAGVVPTSTAVNGGTAHPPYRRIQQSGTRACLGSGGPDQAPSSPWVTLWYTISGRTHVPDQGGVAPDQRLSREQALELATRRCAWFMGLDDRIGALEVGKLADLVVLDADYFTVPVDRIRSLSSVLTMVGGRVVYASGRYAPLEDG